MTAPEGIGIALSILLHFVIRDSVEGEAQLRFERQASDAQHVIEARIHSYADVMYGLRALFSASSVSRTEFHRYVAGLELAYRYPGFWGINYAEWVTHDAKVRFEARVRKDTGLDPRGYPKFSIIPPGDRPEYYVLTYLEPMAGNESVFGLDISTNPAAKNPRAIAEALASARDSGKLTSSGQLLRQKSFTGLSMRLPVYRPGMPVATVEQRRAAYLGSLGAGFRVKELMRGVLDDHALEVMRFKLYEAGPAENYAAARQPVGADHLLFDSNELFNKTAGTAVDASNEDSSFKTVLPIEVAGRIWEVHFRTPTKAIIDRTDLMLPWLTLAAGLVSSFLLFLALYSLASSRRRAVEIASVITKDLRQSEASLAEAQHMARLGNWSLDLASGTMDWSAEMYRIFGFNPAFPPPYEDFLRHIHAKDRASFNEALQEALRASQDCKIEHRIVLKNGITRWVQTIAQPAQNARQAVVRGTVMDITESKLAALRLQVEHRVAQLVASTEDPDQAMPQIIENELGGKGACDLGIPRPHEEDVRPERRRSARPCVGESRTAFRQGRRIRTGVQSDCSSPAGRPARCACASHHRRWQGLRGDRVIQRRTRSA